MSHRAASSGLSGEENLIQCGTFAVRWHHFSFHPLIWQHLIPAGPPRAIVNLLLAPTHVKWPFVSHMDKTEQRRGNNNVVSNIYIQNISNIYWSEDNIDALSLYKSDLMEEWPIPVYYRLPALFFFFHWSTLTQLQPLVFCAWDGDVTTKTTKKPPKQNTWLPLVFVIFVI